MRARRVRLLGIAACLPVAAAVLATPSSAAPVSVPGLLRDVTPSALTARFEKCMQVAPALSTAGVNGAQPQPRPPGNVAPAVTPAVPSAAECLANLGFGDRTGLREQTTLCTSRQGVVRTICLNRVFAALAPGSVASPGTTPTSSPTSGPATPPPTTKRTSPPKPTAPPTAEPTPVPLAATENPTPERTPKPTVAPTPAGTPPPTAPVIAVVPQTPRLTPAPAPASTPPPTPTPTLQPTPTPTPTPTPRQIVNLVAIDVNALAIGGLGAALALIAGVILVRRTRSTKKETPQMHRLTIAGPRDGSIAVAGKPVTFTAHADPPSLAAKITWSVTTQPGVHGIGPAFAHTFPATGAEQVVARLADDALACDVVVYVFKTPTGGSTLDDLVRAEPPPVARSAGAFTRYGTSASAPGKAS